MIKLDLLEINLGIVEVMISKVRFTNNLAAHFLRKRDLLVHALSIVCPKTIRLWRRKVCIRESFVYKCKHIKTWHTQKDLHKYMKMLSIYSKWKKLALKYNNQRCTSIIIIKNTIYSFLIEWQLSWFNSWVQYVL